MEEWVFISDEHVDEQGPVDDPVFWSTDYSDCIPGTTRIGSLGSNICFIVISFLVFFDGM